MEIDGYRQDILAMRWLHVTRRKEQGGKGNKWFSKDILAKRWLHGYREKKIRRKIEIDGYAQDILAKR